MLQYSSYQGSRVQFSARGLVIMTEWGCPQFCRENSRMVWQDCFFLIFFFLFFFLPSSFSISPLHLSSSHSLLLLLPSTFPFLRWSSNNGAPPSITVFPKLPLLSILICPFFLWHLSSLVVLVLISVFLFFFMFRTFFSNPSSFLFKICIYHLILLHINLSFNVPIILSSYFSVSLNLSFILYIVCVV